MDNFKTILPLRVDLVAYPSRSCAEVLDAQGRKVAGNLFIDDAKMIVEKVNGHDALISLCRRQNEMLKLLQEITNVPDKHLERNMTALLSLDALIREADEVLDVKR